MLIIPMLAPENMPCVWIESLTVASIMFLFTLLRCFWLYADFATEYFRHPALLFLRCYGVAVKAFKVLVTTQFHCTVVGHIRIRKSFDAGFSDSMVCQFAARRQWKVLRGT